MQMRIFGLLKLFMAMSFCLHGSSLLLFIIFSITNDGKMYMRLFYVLLWFVVLIFLKCIVIFLTIKTTETSRCRADLDPLTCLSIFMKEVIVTLFALGYLLFR